MRRPSGPGRADVVRTVVVDGRRLRVSVRLGTGGGLPLLLCNGIGSSLELLEPFVAAFDPGTTLIRFDVPGVGGSPPPTLPYHLAVLGRVVTGMLSELGVGRFDVLGISWGGALAQQLAWQNPRRCRRMVLVATTTGVTTVPGRPAVLARMLTPRRHRDAEYARRVAGELYGGVFRQEPERAAAVLHAHSHLGPGRGYLFQLLAIWGWSSLLWLPTIRQRTLVVAGRDDPIIPAVNARIMAAGLPRATLHLHDDGHLALITSAPAMAGVIQRFLYAG